MVARRRSSARPGTPGPSCCASLAGAPRPRGRRRHGRHPGRHAGGALYPSLAVAYPGPRVRAVRRRRDLRRRARPRVPRPPARGRAWTSCRSSSSDVGCIVDLSAAFRLHDAGRVPAWYGFEHDQPELLAEAVYGLPERTRAQLPGARLVATPGCYVTAATLALAPLLDAGLVEPTGHHRRRRQRRHRRRPRADRGNGVLHRRRELHRLRPARPPPHAGDRAEPRRPRCCSRRTSRR